MPIARPFLLALCAVLFCAMPAPSRAAQAAPAQPAPAATAAPPAAKQQAYTLPPGKLAKAIALSRIRNILAIVGSLWGLAVLWLLLATRAAAGLEAWVRRRTPSRWRQGLLFFAAFLVITTLASLPLDLYAHHVSRAYGISVQGWAGWAGDLAKSLGITLLIGCPVLLLFHRIVCRWPRRYWLGLWMVSLPLMLLGTLAAPLLDRAFNTFEPLQKANPALVQQLERVVARTGIQIPPSRMFLMKASAKTNGLNAYVTGIGATRRIVVWDTTAGRIPNDEILFIFGHETGHYVLHHIQKGLALSAAGLFFGFWFCSLAADRLARRYGVRWGLSIEQDSTSPLASRTGFLVLLFVFAVGSFLSQPLSNAISRHFEHQADIYGQEAIHGIVPDPQKTTVAAFNDLGKAWLDDPNPSPFIEFWLYDHPSTQQRASFALHYNPWTNGGHGRYFSH